GRRDGPRLLLRARAGAGGARRRVQRGGPVAARLARGGRKREAGGRTLDRAGRELGPRRLVTARRGLRGTASGALGPLAIPRDERHRGARVHAHGGRSRAVVAAAGGSPAQRLSSPLPELARGPHGGAAEVPAGPASGRPLPAPLE